MKERSPPFIMLSQAPHIRQASPARRSREGYGQMSHEPPWRMHVLRRPLRSCHVAAAPHTVAESTGGSGRAESCKVPKHQLSEPVCLQSDFLSAASLSSGCSAHGLGMELGSYCPRFAEEKTGGQSLSPTAFPVLPVARAMAPCRGALNPPRQGARDCEETGESGCAPREASVPDPCSTRIPEAGVLATLATGLWVAAGHVRRLCVWPVEGVAGEGSFGLVPRYFDLNMQSRGGTCHPGSLGPRTMTRPQNNDVETVLLSQFSAAVPAPESGLFDG
uniref:Uncharacterized protein n=1 Tax=Rangifer tarandus platyrhynchus TaxID=3082113 RepID=A0ACB0DWT6_RANTA|nr:unnamed protein product [Rangifer tarandus platyrhynchus]